MTLPRSSDSRPPWHARLMFFTMDLAAAGAGAVMALYTWGTIAEIVVDELERRRRKRSQEATPTPEQPEVAESPAAESEPPPAAPGKRRWWR